MTEEQDDRLTPNHGSRNAAGRPLVFGLLALLILVALGLGLWLLVRATQPASTPNAAITIHEEAAPSSAQPAPGSVPADTTLADRASTAPSDVENDAPLPALERSDAEVRASLGDILPLAVQTSLKADELIRRAAVLLDNFARGKLLRDKLPLPTINATLLVEERGDQIYLASANFARYDSLVDALADLDVRALGRWFNRYEPLLQQAYAELGSGNASVRTLLLSGIDLALAAPEARGDIELLQPAVFYKFADPQLEQLPDSAKVLIRVGPRNRAILIDRLTRLRQAIASGYPG